MTCDVTVIEATQSIRFDSDTGPDELVIDVGNEDAPFSATLVGAWYDADGRLLGVKAKTVKAPDLVWLECPAGVSGAASCRAFLLGSDFKPLCLSKSASLQREPSSE